MAEMSEIELDRLVARIRENRAVGHDALELGREHRARSSDWLTASTLITLELLRAGVDGGATVAYRLEGALGRTGSVTPGGGACADTRIARLVMGPAVDRRRAYRVAAAARFLLATGANDPAEALRSAGGVSALATAWGRRTDEAVPARAPEGAWPGRERAAPALLGEVPLRAPAELGAELRATRGTVFALIEVGPDGRPTLRALDADASRLVPQSA